MSSQPIDYTALAKQAGAVASEPAKTDYAALAKQAGAVSSTPAPKSFGQELLDEAVINPAKQVASGFTAASATANRLTANTAHILDALHGVVSKASNLPKTGVFKAIEDWARENQHQQEETAQDLSGGRQDLASQIYRGTTQGVAEAPQYIIAGKVLGPTGGMAALGGLRESDKGWWEALKSAAEGAAMGQALEVMGPAKRWVRLAGAAAMTYAQARLQGADNTTALAQATSMGIMSAHGESPLYDSSGKPIRAAKPGESLAKPSEPLPEPAMAVPVRAAGRAVKAGVAKTGEALRNAIPPVPSSLNPVQQANVDYLRESGIPITAGAQTGNQWLRDVEKVTAHTAFGASQASDFNRGTERGLAEKARELVNATDAEPAVPETAGAAAQQAIDAKLLEANGALADRADALARSLHPEPQTPESVGQYVPAVLGQKIDGIAAVRDAAYDKAWAGREDPRFDEVVPVRTEQVRIDSAGNILERGQRGEGPVTVEERPIMGRVNMPVDVRDIKEQARPQYEALKWRPAGERAQSAAFAALEKLLEGPDFIPAWQAEWGLSGLKDMARANRKSGVRDMAEGVAAGLVPDLQAGIDAAVAKTGPEALQGLREGRARHAELMGVADIADQIRKEPVQAFGQLTNKNDSGVEFLRNVLGLAPEAAPRIARAWFDRALSNVTEKGWSGAGEGIHNAYRDLGPSTRELLLRDPTVREHLDTFFDDVRPENQDVAQVAKQLSKEPVKAFRQLTTAGDANIGFTRKVAQYAPEVMPKAGRAMMQELIDVATQKGGFSRAQGILADWNNVGPQTKALLIPDPALRGAWDRFLNAAQYVAENPNSSGTSLVEAAKGMNPIKWAAGFVGGKILFTPEGIARLTGNLEELGRRGGTPPAGGPAGPTPGSSPTAGTRSASGAPGAAAQNPLAAAGAGRQAARQDFIDRAKTAGNPNQPTGQPGEAGGASTEPKYSIATPRGVLMGINVASDVKSGVRYADEIVDGRKTFETRTSRSLDPYIGKRVAIVRTGEGPAAAIGEVTVGKPIIADAAEFRRLQDQHLVPPGSTFDVAPGQSKVLYPMLDPVRYGKEVTDLGRGIVSRQVRPGDGNYSIAESGIPEGEFHLEQHHVEAAFPGQKVTTSDSGGFVVARENGRPIHVLPDRTIAVDTGAASKAYGEPIAPGTKARGSYTRIDGNAMIQLARTGGGLETLRHEVFHAAMDLVLRPREQAAVLKTHGSEEAAASAFSQYVPRKTADPSGMFAKIADYFTKLYRNLRPTADSVFEKISAGEVWDRKAENTARTAIDPNYSLNTYPNWEKAFRKKAKEVGLSDEDTERTLRAAATARMLMAAKPDLAPEDAKGNPLRKNTDFGFSFDLDTICSRAQDFYSTVEAIQKQAGQVVNGDEWVSLTMLMREFGEATNCGHCYSAAGRGVMSEMEWRTTQQPFAVKVRKTLYGPEEAAKLPPMPETLGPEHVGQLYSVKEPGTLRAAKVWPTLDPEHWIEPEKADAKAAQDAAFKEHLAAARSYVGGASAGLANKRKVFTPYAAQFLDAKTYPDEKIALWNQNWGVRTQSHTDLKPWHALDFSQFLTDATIRKAAAHNYTKEPWLLRIFGDTNLKINLSMLGEWDPAAKKTVYDKLWGLDEDFVKQAYKRYPNAGGIVTAMQREVVIDAMRPENKHIGQIIPEHASGLTKAQLASYAWENFTAAHEEAFNKWDAPEGFVRTAGMKDSIQRGIHHDNVETFLAQCEKNGLRPRFAEFIYQLDKDGHMMRDAEGAPIRRWTGPEGMKNTAALLGVKLDVRTAAKVRAYGKEMEKGYMKLVSDFARTDTPFLPIDASKIDQKALTQLIKDWHATGRKASDDGIVNQDLVDEFIRRRAAGTLPNPHPLYQIQSPTPAPLFGLPERTLSGRLKAQGAKAPQISLPKADYAREEAYFVSPEGKVIDLSNDSHFNYAINLLEREGAKIPNGDWGPEPQEELMRRGWIRVRDGNIGTTEAVLRENPVRLQEALKKAFRVDDQIGIETEKNDFAYVDRKEVGEFLADPMKFIKRYMKSRGL